MAFTNTFHSSAKGHAIGGAGKLSAVQKHNERGYFSFYYDSSKIHSVIGDVSNLAADVEDYINEKFQPAVDEYNEKQKRNDRKIKVSPFEHFCNNKKLDIANEVIFQVGDMDFWSKERIETEIIRNGKKKILNDFSDEVKKVMDSIFEKQALAYEQIYETHANEILSAIEEDYEKAKSFILSLNEEELKQFEKIQKKKDKKTELKNLTVEQKEKFESFLNSKATIEFVDDKRIFSRIKNKEMTIKLINLTSHYDEKSPHAHGVSVCSCKGYEKSLSERVAKSIVLNKWTLSILQDRMHEIAKEEMTKHPELFNIELQEKQPGRNYDFTIDGYIRNQLEKEVKNLKEERAALENEIADLTSIKTLAERDAVASDVLKEINEVTESWNEVDVFMTALKEDLEYRNGITLKNIVADFLWEWQELRDRTSALFSVIAEKIKNIDVFEKLKHLPALERKAPGLQERLNKATKESEHVNKTASEVVKKVIKEKEQDL